MINIVIEDVIVNHNEQNNFGQKWYVSHPNNPSILAYCDTENEAKRVRDAINDLARQLRSLGFQVC